MIRYRAVPETSEVLLTFEGAVFGTCKLWMPEGIATPRGLAGVYPRGMCWREHGKTLLQDAFPEHLFGPGNVSEVEPGVLECCGVRYAKEPAIPWKSSLRISESRVDFSLSLHNPHKTAVREVSAPLCLKFMEAGWWSPRVSFFATAEGIRSIGQVPWIEGSRPQFQKWNIGSHTPFDNPVKNGIWTSNPMLATSPTWVVQPENMGPALVFRCDSAYYIHCNRNNPCNDLAMLFGDLEPGRTKECTGSLELTEGATADMFAFREIMQRES